MAREHRDPAAPSQDHLLAHDYDGIREYDNPMPRWWVYIFVVTIVFAGIYALNVIRGVGAGPGRIANYEREMAAFRAAHPAGGPTMGAAALAALARDPKALELGKTTFAQNCSSCHRADAGGLIGPNLTDDYWLHGGALPEIYTTVSEGVLAKGMPNWGKLLKPDQVAAVAAYVYTLHGSNPPNPKAPQGSFVKPEAPLAAAN